MNYISTRGQAPALNFEDVLLTGLAPDGGLYVPATLPQFSAAEIRSWRKLGYADLAKQIIPRFVADAIPAADLNRLLDETYAGFRHPAVAPLVQLAPNEWLLELFHGPTLAFKDFALQLLGRLFDYVLTRRRQRVVIMGATSGDTGSAAIEGCRHSSQVDIFILHPHQRISEVQRRQMTSCINDHIFNIAVEGNFDDCQAMVKASFADQSFLPDGRQLVAVNSINWARIMAQIVYYFAAGLAVGAPGRKLSFSVPTGNFGDIYAGWLAKRMGLPVQQLIIATNSNDILHRFMSHNLYQQQPLVHSLSPSMDIMVSSNFERALFDLYEGDGAAIAALMGKLNREPVSVPEAVFTKAREVFDSFAVDDKLTLQTISTVYNNSGYLLDPHSAIAVTAARACNRDASLPMIILGTAHPAKFPAAVKQAGCGQPVLPPPLRDLLKRDERYTVLPNELAQVQAFISDNTH